MKDVNWSIYWSTKLRLVLDALYVRHELVHLLKYKVTSCVRRGLWRTWTGPSIEVQSYVLCYTWFTLGFYWSIHVGTKSGLRRLFPFSHWLLWIPPRTSNTTKISNLSSMTIEHKLFKSHKFGFNNRARHISFKDKGIYSKPPGLLHRMTFSLGALILKPTFDHLGVETKDHLRFGVFTVGIFQHFYLEAGKLWCKISSKNGI